MECTYYYCNTGKYIKHECIKKDKKVSKKCYYKYCSNSSYDSCPIYENDKNCFFIAILCENIGLPKDNPILNNLHNLRKNILEQDERYKELLIIHDRISPIISNAIRNNYTSSLDEFINYVYINFLIYINECITNNEFEKAITYYKKMLELLIVNFNLGKEYADIKYYYKYPEQYKTRVRNKIYF